MLHSNLFDMQNDYLQKRMQIKLLTSCDGLPYKFLCQKLWLKWSIYFINQYQKAFKFGPYLDSKSQGPCFLGGAGGQNLGHIQRYEKVLVKVYLVEYILVDYTGIVILEAF